MFKAFIIINKFLIIQLLYLVFSFSGAAVKVQRKIESKASSGNNRSAQNNSKAGPANKSLTVETSVRQARRNVVRT